MQKILKVIFMGILCFGFVFSAFACGNSGVPNENSTTESSQGGFDENSTMENLGDSITEDSKESDKNFAESQKSDIYGLQEIYAAEKITKYHLLSIAYHSGNAEYNGAEIDEDFVAASKGELTDELSLKIRESLTGFEIYDNVKADDFVIMDYYGCYNGYYAFRYENLTAYEPAEVMEIWEEIDGVKFLYTSTYRIQLWKEENNL